MHTRRAETRARARKRVLTRNSSLRLKVRHTQTFTHARARVPQHTNTPHTRAPGKEVHLNWAERAGSPDTGGCNWALDMANQHDVALQVRSGGQVDITNGKFVFSCTEAYRVKNGVVGAPLKGATLIGDGATALKHIHAIGNDMALDPGMGNCGKAGQWVPVGVGQPTLMIGGLTIGGSKI